MNVKFTGKLLQQGKFKWELPKTEPNGVPKSMLLRS